MSFPAQFEDEANLKLAIGLGREFGVDKVGRGQDGPVVDQPVEEAPVAVEGVQDAQKGQHLQRRVVDRDALGQLHRQHRRQRRLRLGRHAVYGEVTKKTDGFIKRMFWNKGRERVTVPEVVALLFGRALAGRALALARVAGAGRAAEGLAGGAKAGGGGGSGGRRRLGARAGADAVADAGRAAEVRRVVVGHRPVADGVRLHPNGGVAHGRFRVRVRFRLIVAGQAALQSRYA